MLGEDCQSDTPPNCPDLSVVVNPRVPVIITMPANMSVAPGIEQQLQQPQFFHVDASYRGCQPEEVQAHVEAMLAARLTGLQEELRRQSELLAWRSSSLAHLTAIRDDLILERCLATKAIANVVKQKKHLQWQAGLWRGIIAVRKPATLAERKLKYWTKRDKHWSAKRLKVLRRQLAPLQRELAALKMQEREQTDSIRMWQDRLPEEEASFVRWYEEELKADTDSVNPIPSTTHALTDGQSWLATDSWVVSG